MGTKDGLKSKSLTAEKLLLKSSRYRFKARHQRLALVGRNVLQVLMYAPATIHQKISIGSRWPLTQLVHRKFFWQFQKPPSSLAKSIWSGNFSVATRQSHDTCLFSLANNAGIPSTRDEDALPWWTREGCGYRYRHTDRRGIMMNIRRRSKRAIFLESNLRCLSLERHIMFIMLIIPLPDVALTVELWKSKIMTWTERRLRGASQTSKKGIVKIDSVLNGGMLYDNRYMMIVMHLA